MPELGLSLRVASGAGQDRLARVVHDLRAPLQAIRGECFTLRRAGVSARQRAGLRAIDAEAVRVSAALDELLRLTGPDPGTDRRRSRVPLTELVLEVARRGAAVARPRRVSLLVRVPPGDPLAVAGDEDGLRRALDNLVQNAVRHSPERGRVDLRAARVGAEAVLTVGDRGAGVPADERERIFLAGVRGRGARGAGAGLGLAIAREAAEAAGGRLELASGGPGAVFRLTLPLLAAASVPRQQPPS
jgi:signal transduction histidine kinase